MHTKCKNLVAEILGLAGVKINGSNPWDIQIHNDEFYRRAITEGELGIGESYMNYSCAYWKNADSLDKAQEDKLELICRKLYLKPGMHLLDIGCGWGAFGKYAAEKYNCEVVGITVSKNQVELGRKLCDGLPVEFLLTDYDKTLMAWYYNFEKNWDKIKKT